jgi:TatD DNase family protein
MNLTPLIDLHCHIDLYPEPLKLAEEANREKIYILSVTNTPSAWTKTNALVKKFPRIKTALGLHPHLAHQRANELSLFETLVREVKYVGEVGLDGSKDFRMHTAAQLAVFTKILRLCSLAGGRILSIHSRGAAGAVLDELAVNPDFGKAIFHWFSGGLQDLKRAIDMGCWFSVGPAMLQSKRGRTLIAHMPRNRVLTETDGPFAQVARKPVTPSDVRIAIELLAQIWDEPIGATHGRMVQSFRDLVTLPE